jgi:curli biogenesis system outer membrane secretion channel CsgG
MAPRMTPEAEHVGVLAKVKQVARQHHKLTGRRLRVTGEIAEYEVAIRLGGRGLELLRWRQAGYDATQKTNRKRKQRLQVKGRLVLDSSQSHQVGAINLENEWDAVLLVLLDRNYDLTAIHEASRENIEEALSAEPVSKARARGVLSVSKFKNIGVQIWPATR